MQQVALGEDGEAGGAAAHVDDRGAELLLVLDQRRQAGGEGAETSSSTSRSQRIAGAEVAQRRLRRIHACAAARSSVSQIMPRGSSAPGVASTVKPSGKACTVSRPPRRAARPSFTTARRSASVTARPPIATACYWRDLRLAAGQVDDDRCAAWCRPCPRPGRPRRGWRPRPPRGRRCCRPYAARALPAEARAPALRHRSRCGRSGRRSWWCRRRARRRAGRCWRRARRLVGGRRVSAGGRRGHLVHPPRRSSALCVLGRAAAGRRLRRQAQHQPVRQPQVDRDQRPVEQRLLACNSASRSIAAASWPRAAARRCRCAVAGSSAARRPGPARGTRSCTSGAPAQRVDQRRAAWSARRRRRPAAGGRRRRHSGRHHLALAVDRPRMAVVLPDGEGLPLLQPHPDGAGQQALDMARSTQAIVSSAARAASSGEAEDRVAAARRRALRAPRLGRVACALDPRPAPAARRRRRSPPRRPTARRAAIGSAAMTASARPSTRRRRAGQPAGAQQAAARGAARAAAEAAAGAAERAAGRRVRAAARAGRASRAMAAPLHHPGAERREARCRNAPPARAPARSASCPGWVLTSSRNSRAGFALRCRRSGNRRAMTPRQPSARCAATRDLERLRVDARVDRRGDDVARCRRRRISPRSRRSAGVGVISVTASARSPMTRDGQLAAGDILLDHHLVAEAPVRAAISTAAVVALAQDVRRRREEPSFDRLHDIGRRHRIAAARARRRSTTKPAAHAAGRRRRTAPWPPACPWRARRRARPSGCRACRSQLEHALDAAILAVAAVQRVEDDVGPPRRARRCGAEIGADIDRRCTSKPASRSAACTAAPDDEADLALGRDAAVAGPRRGSCVRIRPARPGRPMRLISHSSATPTRAPARGARTSSPSASRSAAVALAGVDQEVAVLLATPAPRRASGRGSRPRRSAPRPCGRAGS